MEQTNLNPVEQIKELVSSFEERIEEIKKREFPTDDLALYRSCGFILDRRSIDFVSDKDQIRRKIEETIESLADIKREFNITAPVEMGVVVDDSEWPTRGKIKVYGFVQNKEQYEYEKKKKNEEFLKQKRENKRRTNNE